MIVRRIDVRVSDGREKHADCVETRVAADRQVESECAMPVLDADVRARLQQHRNGFGRLRRRRTHERLHQWRQTVTPGRAVHIRAAGKQRFAQRRMSTLRSASQCQSQSLCGRRIAEQPEREILVAEERRTVHASTRSTGAPREMSKSTRSAEPDQAALWSAL